MYIDTESSNIELHRRLRGRAEAELKSYRKLNPRIGDEAIRCEAVNYFAELAQLYANEGSAKMSQAMAIAAAHLGMTSGDREHMPAVTPATAPASPNGLPRSA
jgi:hypothetical protein